MHPFANLRKIVCVIFNETSVLSVVKKKKITAAVESEKNKWDEKSKQSKDLEHRKREEEKFVCHKSQVGAGLSPIPANLIIG